VINMPVCPACNNEPLSDGVCPLCGYTDKSAKKPGKK